MAKLHFKPMPALTIVLVISLAILISLGAWQYQRLQWKTALLAEIEASVTAPPFKTLAEVSRAIDEEAPVDFRRVEFEAKTIANSSAYHLYKSQAGGIFWNVIQPLRVDGRTIFASMTELTNDQKDAAPSQVQARETISVTGYVRKSYPMGRVESWVKSKASPETNRYFYFNQTQDWYENMPGPYIEDYYIDVVPAASAEVLPVLRPDIANNHFDYMLTWWSFALIFIVIYLILHRRAGRLAFR